ncbi:MAG: ketoacyl-ACP synthase III [Deltaproteobacteria bacterium]|jgi:3-oxoacyl-[acyl-carrier-protein] synthase-3|nr:ketoacyl-ACP synthase III [Deltaproteobacteria bacterium]
MTDSIYFNGFGYYAPKRIIDNAEMCTIVDTTDEWIQSRTGIKERHIVAPGETCSDMGLVAARQALEAAGMNADEITVIMCATVSADSIVPSTATRLQQKLGATKAMAFDFNAACSGYLYGMQIAQGLLAANPEHKILLLAAEVLTSRTNWTDRTTCVLFGDGAGVAILSSEKRSPANPTIFSHNARLEGVMSAADGTQGDFLTAIGGTSGHPYKLGDTVGDEFFIKMNGREVYKHAVRNMPALCNELMDSLGYTIDDIDALIPHQANLRIIEAVGERLNMPAEKVFVNVQKYGNTSCASIPLALGEAIEQNFIRPGMRVLLTTFGGGLTWSAAILKF